MADYASEMESLQRVSVVELVATLRAKARRHGTQTSRYRGVSLLKQTGKWHGQINVGGKQLHLGFFDTEELAARAYDRAAIHKAFAEGGVVVTNLDVDQYAHEMDKLRAMTRAELLAMIADEKRGHGGVEKSGDGEKTRAAPGERRERSARAAASAKSRRGSAATREKETGNAGSGGTSANSRGSSEARPGSEAGVREGSADEAGSGGSGGTSRSDLTRVGGPLADGESDVALRGKGGGAAPASGDGSMPTSGSGDGSGGSSPMRMFDVAPRSGWPSGDEHAGSGDDRAGRFEGKKETTPEGSSGDERATSEKATSGKRGTKRSAAPPMPPPSPRVPGKQRRTKQAPRQAPCAA